MNKMERIGVKALLRRWACSIIATLLWTSALVAQVAATPSQETINRRIAEIIENALARGVSTTPEGVRVTRGKVDISLEELKEIEAFGESAIAPLSNYLQPPDTPNYRAQLLVVNVLGSIGGNGVIRPLGYAAERSGSSSVRRAAVMNLGLQPWPEVADIIERVAANDAEAVVKNEALAIIAKHRPPGNQ